MPAEIIFLPCRLDIFPCFMSLKSGSHAKCFSDFLILARLLSAGFKYLTKHHLKHLQKIEAAISPGKVALFCLFVTCCYTSMKLHCYHIDFQYLWKVSYAFVDFLQAVVCLLLDIHWRYRNMLFWTGIVRHSFLANQIVT